MRDEDARALRQAGPAVAAACATVGVDVPSGFGRDAAAVAQAVAEPSSPAPGATATSA